ncbi:MAG: hypothetical protein OXQ32_03030 [bacterium]|nr:hypothetical protein [bacterium]
MLSVARRSAIEARTQAINQHALVETAPAQVKTPPYGSFTQSPRQGGCRVPAGYC